MLDNELIADDLDDIYRSADPFEGYDDSMHPLTMFGLLIVTIIMSIAVYRLGCW